MSRLGRDAIFWPEQEEQKEVFRDHDPNDNEGFAPKPAK